MIILILSKKINYYSPYMIISIITIRTGVIKGTGGITSDNVSDNICIKKSMQMTNDQYEASEEIRLSMKNETFHFTRVTFYSLI